MTFHPKVKESWLGIPIEGVKFKNWIGISSQKIARYTNSKSYKCLDDNFDVIKKSTENLVFFISMQDLDLNKDRLKKAHVFKTHWDCLVYDEVHYGEDTIKTQQLLSNLKFKYRIDMSGTPFKFMDKYNLDKKQIFIYTYLDEYQDKKEEERNNPNNTGEFVYRQYPTLNLMTLDLDQSDINFQREKSKTADKDYSLNERFKLDQNGAFIYDQSVNLFLDRLVASGHDNTGLSVYGDLGKECNFSTEKRHSIWWVNGVKTAKALEDKLNKHNSFKKYKIINVAGQENDIEESDLKRQIEEADSNLNQLGSITLTVNRFTTGTTVKEWDSILTLKDSQSPEDYFQTIFRIQSPWVKGYKNKPIKKDVYVFDFSIQRVLTNIYKLAEQLQNQRGIKINTNVQNLLKAMNVNSAQFIDGELKIESHTFREVLRYYYYRPLSLAKRINSRKNLISTNWLKILNNNPDLEHIISKIKGYRNINEEKEQPNKTILSGGEIQDLKKDDREREFVSSKKTNRSYKLKTQQQKANEKRIKEIRNQAVRLSVVLIDFMYMTRKREESLDHILRHRKTERDFFKDVTGITVEEFEQLCNSGLLVKKELNGRIYNFFTEERSSIRPEQYIFNHIDKKSA